MTLFADYDALTSGADRPNLPRELVCQMFYGSNGQLRLTVDGVGQLSLAMTPQQGDAGDFELGSKEDPERGEAFLPRIAEWLGQSPGAAPGRPRRVPLTGRFRKTGKELITLDIGDWGRIYVRVGITGRLLLGSESRWQRRDLFALLATACRGDALAPLTPEAERVADPPMRIHRLARDVRGAMAHFVSKASRGAAGLTVSDFLTWPRSRTAEETALLSQALAEVSRDFSGPLSTVAHLHAPLADASGIPDGHEGLYRFSRWQQVLLRVMDAVHRGLFDRWEEARGVSERLIDDRPMAGLALVAALGHPELAVRAASLGALAEDAPQRGWLRWLAGERVSGEALAAQLLELPSSVRPDAMAAALSGEREEAQRAIPKKYIAAITKPVPRSTTAGVRLLVQVVAYRRGAMVDEALLSKSFKAFFRWSTRAPQPEELAGKLPYVELTAVWWSSGRAVGLGARPDVRAGRGAAVRGRGTAGGEGAAGPVRGVRGLRRKPARGDRVQIRGWG